MSFTLERYVTVDAELQQLQQYLASLAGEIDAAMPATNRYGFVYPVASQVAEQIKLLCCLLADEQENACKTLVFGSGEGTERPATSAVSTLPVASPRTTQGRHKEALSSGT